MAIEIIFTIISLISASLALLVIFPVMIILINHLRKKRDVVLLLMTNTYITMFTHCFLILLVNINVLQADLNDGSINSSTSDSTACHFQGFLLYVTFGWCYMSFLLQALYRFTRVLYARQRIFQSFNFNIISILIQWIVGFLIQLPVYLWSIPMYGLYKMDYYCGIPYEKTWGMFYVALNIFISPVILLTIIYACLLYFIRHQSPQTLQTQQGKKIQRDFIVTRRILFIVNVLTMPGLPNATFFAMSSINPSVSGYYFMYRIQWMGPIIIIFFLSIILVIITPQLKKLIMNGRIHPENQIETIRPTKAEQRTQHLMTARIRF